MIPAGAANDAAVPVPSAEPAVPVPANTVVTPADVTFRIMWLTRSATKVFPRLSCTMRAGLLKRAAVPVPSVAPVRPGDPAKAVEDPSAATTLITCSPISLTTRLFEESTAIPIGESQLAETPGPLLVKGTPAIDEVVADPVAASVSCAKPSRPTTLDTTMILVERRVPCDMNPPMDVYVHSFGTRRK